MRKYLLIVIIVGFVSLFSILTFAANPSQFHSRATSIDPLQVVHNYQTGVTQNSLLSTPDTVRVLALRAEFVQDNLATTTGNGLFDLSTTSNYVIDRPPHDRAYFQQHLQGLSNYFKQVSRGRLIIEADVLPEAELQVYTLPQNMVYYSGQENDELKKQRWAELLRDVITLAKEQDHPDFSRYDAVIVFHAGVGSDFAFDFDATPYDIQSVFIDYETLLETLGKDLDGYQGIDVGNNVYIKEGIILPEMQNQEDQVLGLFGTMTLLMGSQLGMPSLYNTIDGSAGIGRWGLMDQGSYNFYGLIPAEPCAWTKIYMGWEEPVVITSGENVRIGDSKSKSAPHIYKIPITAREYFLVENRQKDHNKDGVTFGRGIDGSRAQFDSLGSVVVDAAMRVITSIDEYDFGLPGSGLLIWHIDEDVIAENLASNKVNQNREHRGVDLVECDGAQDIGYYYGMFEPGSGTESGDYFDPFWSGNISHKIVNNDADTVAFSARTVPNSNGYQGAITHINLYNISANDSVMTFSLRSDLAQAGFPQYAGTGFASGALKPVALAGNEQGVIAVSLAGHVLGWKYNGEKIIANNEIQDVHDVYGSAVTRDYALFASCTDSVLLPPAIADLDGDGSDKVVVADNRGIINIWKTVDANQDGRADLFATANIIAKPTAGPMIVNGSNGVPAIIVGAADGQVTKLQVNGELYSQQQTDLQSGAVCGLACQFSSLANAPVIIAVTKNGQLVGMDLSLTTIWQALLPFSASRYYVVNADFNGNGRYETIVLGSGGDYAIYNNSELLYYRKLAGAVITSPPAIGDADNDGLPEVLFTSGKYLHALKYNGLLATNFPVMVNANGGEQANAPSLLSLSEPSLGPVIFIPAADGMIRAVNSKTRAIAGFPLTAGTGIAATPLLLDIDKDNDLECLTLSGDGCLYAWNLDLKSGSETRWLQYGGNSANTFALAGAHARVISGAGLLPEKKAYCYPNPVYNGVCNIRYLLTDNAESVSVRIYDIAGDLVTEINAPETTIGEHEVQWDVASVQSGSYIARIEAKRNNDNGIKFIKIAVVK